MILALKAFGRMAILMTLVGMALGVTMVVEIVIDQLTYQSRDMRHLLKHSLGNVGSLLVAVSIAGYMLKKRYKGFPGKARDWLEIHQWLSVIGVAMVGVHTGAHLVAAVPAIALALTVACLFSGFVGRHIYNRTMKDLTGRRTELARSGAAKEDIEEELALLAAAAGAMGRWRELHRPMSLALGFLLFWHVAAALFFGG